MCDESSQLTAENGMLMTPCYTANYVAPEVLKVRRVQDGSVILTWRCRNKDTTRHAISGALAC